MKKLGGTNPLLVLRLSGGLAAIGVTTSAESDFEYAGSGTFV